MACAACGANKQIVGNKQYIPPVNQNTQPCVYTVSELEDKLVIAHQSENWSQVSFIQSAINYYNKSCNEFNSYIL